MDPAWPSPQPGETHYDYVKENRFTFTVSMKSRGENDIGRAYKTQAYPDNFLLDSEGRIVWRSEGFDEDGLCANLAKPP